ncbi:hypothetical protein ACSE3M_01120 [Bacillus velezensis]
MPVGPYFKIGYAVLLLFLIIYLGTLIDFLFQPVVITVKTLFPPIVLSGVLYYLCRPLVRVLHAKLKLPEGMAILAIYAGTAKPSCPLPLYGGPCRSKTVYSLHRTYSGAFRKS